MNADILKGPAGYALVVLAGGVVLWLLWDKAEKTTKDLALGVAGAVSGNNAVTQNQHNFAGEDTDAYVDKGVFGTLGATANSASGGLLASAGETIGGWVFDLFGPKVK